MSVKICRDCKHFKPNTTQYFTTKNAIKFGLCTHESSTYTNYISGEKTYYMAHEIRGDRYFKSCGHNAQFYEENEDELSKTLAEVSVEDVVRIVFLVFTLSLCKATFGR